MVPFERVANGVNLSFMVGRGNGRTRYSDNATLHSFVSLSVDDAELALDDLAARLVGTKPGAIAVDRCLQGPAKAPEPEGNGRADDGYQTEHDDTGKQPGNEKNDGGRNGADPRQHARDRTGRVAGSWESLGHDTMVAAIAPIFNIVPGNRAQEAPFLKK